MEIIITIILIIGLWIYVKVQELKTVNHCNKYQIDWRKANEDRIMNDLSDWQVKQNINNGKYNKR